jgi:hypothetical protein
MVNIEGTARFCRCGAQKQAMGRLPILVCGPWIPLEYRDWITVRGVENLNHLDFSDTRAPDHLNERFGLGLAIHEERAEDRMAIDDLPPSAPEAVYVD